MSHDRNPRGGNWLARGEDRVLSEREHRCHAEGCTLEVPPHLLMCREHWFMVPKPLRQEVWRLYQRGQEVSKRPSPEYIAAAKQAIAAVALREGRTQGELL